MTRINLVPPSELTDQHLFAEWREIKMVPKALARSLKARGLHGVLNSIPKEFTLGTGHVMFFYDKGEYLHRRYASLTYELIKRRVNINLNAKLDPDGAFGLSPLCKNYTPTPAALIIIRARIAEKIAMKPTWYRTTTGASHV